MKLLQAVVTGALVLLGAVLVGIYMALGRCWEAA